APLLAHPVVVLLRHLRNRGPAAARNTALDWCWQHEVDTAILIDSDCVVFPNFVALHLAQHHAHPRALGVGGALEARGDGLWARLDGAMSLFPSVPRPDCLIDPPLHAPTNNLSIKLLRRCRELLRFNERLRTGEDVALAQELRRAGEVLRFASAPRVGHFD